MESSELEARLARLESRAAAGTTVNFGGDVERTVNAFMADRSVGNARSLLDAIDRAEPDLDGQVMSGPTITITVTVTVTVTVTHAEETVEPQ